jgi:iron complex outermembrane receptor protein
MIDGQKINSEVSGGALSPNRYLTLDNVKRIEIIRGPASALYGTSALVGVVNIITNTKLNNISAEYNSNDGYKVYTNISKQSENWQMSIFASQFGEKGEFYPKKYTEPFNPEIEGTHDKKHGGDLYFNYKWKDKLNIKARYMKRKLNGFFINHKVDDSLNRLSNEQSFINIDYKLFDRKKYSLNLFANYMYTKEHTTAELYSQNKESEFSLGLNTSYKFNQNHELSTKFSYRNNKILDSNFIDNKKHRGILSGYIQDKYKWSEKFITTLGIRYDKYSGLKSTINSRLGLIYKTDFNATFKLMYGEAFRIPSLMETRPDILGNPNLKQEKIKTFELAWTQKIANSQNTLTYFNNSLKDRIDTTLVRFDDGLYRQFTNVDDLSTTGIELESKIQFNRNFSLRTAYSYLFKSEEEPRRIAQQTFSMIANYKYKAWNFNLQSYYHGKIEQLALFDDGVKTISLDDYWVLNNSVRYKFDNNTTFFLNMSNMLDKEYYSSTKRILFTNGLINRGRNFSIGFEYNF